MFDVVIASCVVLVSASLSAVFWVGAAAVVVSAALNGGFASLPQFDRHP